MDIFLGILVLSFLGFAFLASIGFCVYQCTKAFGFPKAAKWLTWAYAIAVLFVLAVVVFEDQLFSRSDAMVLVEEQDFELRDDFELLHNESFSSIGNYYHTFTLQISKDDKSALIQKITASPNFCLAERGFYPNACDYDSYSGPKRIWNYETPHAYIRAYFQPSGREGYAPIFRLISLPKEKSELVFEDKDY